jgi:hypothetical protein
MVGIPWPPWIAILQPVPIDFQCNKSDGRADGQSSGLNFKLTAKYGRGIHRIRFNRTAWGEPWPRLLDPNDRTCRPGEAARPVGQFRPPRYFQTPAQIGSVTA